MLAGCEIAYNNYAGFDTGWEAGAGKFGHADNDGGTGPGHERSTAERTIARDNYVHHNLGRGLWADVGVVHISYVNNTVVNNTHEGIAHEISHTAVIANNTVCFNGKVFDVWQWGSQILVQNSDSVVVRGNTVVVGKGGNGIGIIYQPRLDNGTAAIAQNNTVVDNAVFFLDANHTAHGFTGGVSNCTPPLQIGPRHFLIPTHIFVLFCGVVSLPRCVLPCKYRIMNNCEWCC